MELFSIWMGNEGRDVIEPVRTWQVRESGNTTKVTSGQAWRCTKCNLHFQIKTQADAHKCGGAKENDG